MLPPCKQLQAIPSRLSNMEMFHQWPILIIGKIYLLPHGVGVGHHKPHMPLSPALCGQQECGCDVAWVEGQTYNKVSFLP